MRELLFLAHRIPFPPDRGDKIRSWHLLREASRHAVVHLACLADDEADAAHLPALRQAMGGRLGAVHVGIRRPGRLAGGVRALAGGRPISLALFADVGLKAFVEGLLERGRVETIFAFSGQMAQYVPKQPGRRFVMDLVDVDLEKFAQYARDGRGPMRIVHSREARLLARFEAETARRADLVLLVSEAEADLFRRRTGLPHIAALSNGIDLDYFDPQAAFTPLSGPERGEGPIVLFTGQMDYAPNVDAVRWFARCVMPRLPGVRFVIVGRNPAPAVRRLAGPYVQVTGEVTDVRPWLAAADVVVAPLKLARGIQNKVLEAMAMARPVVSSPAAFQGIEAEAGRDLEVAGQADAMASRITELLADPEAAARLGERGRVRMTSSYAWSARLRGLDAMLFPVPARAAA